MFNEKGWVIRDENGYFVNVRRTRKGYYYTKYNGKTTGFAYYVNEKNMKKDLEMLGKGFKSEYISLNDIPNGIRIRKD